MANLENISTGIPEIDDDLIGDYNQGVLLPENERPTKKEYVVKKYETLLERAKRYFDTIFKD